MHPTKQAGQLPQRGVQPLVVRRPTTPPQSAGTPPQLCIPSLFHRDERPTLMSSGKSAGVLGGRVRLHDQPLWNVGQRLPADHLPTNADSSRCRNPRCAGLSYPCTPARTAIRLEQASRMSLHKRMTALTDALSCAVSPPSCLGLSASLESTGAERIQPPAPTGSCEVAEPLLTMAAVA